MTVGAIGGATVREATRADHAALTESLAAAFMDDPVANWASPHDGARGKLLSRFFAAYLAAKQKHDFVFADDELRGAALWLPPGKWKTTLGEDLSLVPSMLQWRLLARAPLVGWGMLGAEREHPATPDHFYLAAIGVSPAAQGAGLGSALLAPVLEICDRDGVPAYLEASKFENVDYYARHGFRQTGEIRLPRGPVVYPMWRDPA